VRSAAGTHQQPLTGTRRAHLAHRATAAPAVLLATVGQGVFRGLANMRAPLLITLATNGLHLGLDLLMMFKLGWGIRGAAVSTAASEYLAAGAYTWLIWRQRHVLGLWPPPRVPLAQLRARMAPFAAAASAVVMRTGSLLGTKTLATAVAARLGPSSVASHQVLMQLWVLSSMLVDALAVSGQTLIAVNLGKGQRGAARQISERLLQLGAGAGVALALLSGASAHWWPGLFTADEAILAQIHALLPLAVLPLPVNALVYTLDGVLVGASDFGCVRRVAVPCARACAACCPRSAGACRAGSHPRACVRVRVPCGALHPAAGTS
jgi:MATE family multidrug resistance protein